VRHAENSKYGIVRHAKNSKYGIVRHAENSKYGIMRHAENSKYGIMCHAENCKPQDKKIFNINICKLLPQVYVCVLCDSDERS
jgi:hypothetical protein